MTEIEKMLAREQIRNQLSLYCKGIDRKDWDLVRSCFAAEHHHKHGSVEGSLDDFIAFSATALEPIPVTHHSVANVLVELSEDGKSATSEANFTAIHGIAAGEPGANLFGTGGEAADWIVAGTYTDNWVCRDGQWLIIKRLGVHHWERVESPTRKLTT